MFNTLHRRTILWMIVSLGNSTLPRNLQIENIVLSECTPLSLIALIDVEGRGSVHKTQSLSTGYIYILKHKAYIYMYIYLGIYIYIYTYTYRYIYYTYTCCCANCGPAGKLLATYPIFFHFHSNFLRLKT